MTHPVRYRENIVRVKTNQFVFLYAARNIKKNVRNREEAHNLRKASFGLGRGKIGDLDCRPGFPALGRFIFICCANRSNFIDAQHSSHDSTYGAAIATLHEIFSKGNRKQV